MNQSRVQGKKLIIVAGVLVLLAAAAAFMFYSKKGEAVVLAMVNGQPITQNRLLEEIETIEEPNRSMVKENPAGLLDMMIMKMLLLQEAGVQGFEMGRSDQENDAIRSFLERRFSMPPEVTEQEVEDFYTAHESDMGDMTYEQLKPVIEQVLQREKQEEEYKQFMEEIRSKADIEINTDRLQAIATGPSGSTDGTNTREEFDTALKSGKPVLVDFGSNSCLPCRKLRPILDEIKKEKGGQVEVLVIDVNKHQGLSREYKVRVIPTLVFFDAGGKEVFRTQGFMSKAALLEHLAKVGVV